jgi:PTS system mannose-specific IIB component
MNIKLFRIDDRLIHGQVMTSWSKTTKAERIYIVDDQVVKDEFMCKIMKMAAPNGMEVNVFSIEDGAKVIQEITDEKPTIVLMKVPQTAIKLVENGVPMENLNVGGMGAGPGRKKLYKNISASEEEKETLRSLSEKGVKIEFRIVPDDKGIPLSKVIK